MQRLSVVDTGLTEGNLLTLEVPPDYTQRHDAAVALYEKIQSQVAAIPGVKGVGLGSTVPLRSELFSLDLKAEGRPVAPGEPMPHAEGRTASPEYFRTAGIPLLKGREFSSTDRAGSPLVVILNKTLADRLFPGQDPIGRRVAWTGEVLKFIGVSGDWRTVVGVVGATKDGGLDAGPLPVLVAPFAQAEVFGSSLVIQTAGDPAALAGVATRAVRGVAPEQPVEKVLTLEQIKDESVAPRRLNALLVASFGALAVLIAAVGIAGVLAFSVSARTNEIGIRMSLGADSGRVQRMVLAEGGVLLVAGLLLGVLGSLLATRMIRGLLYGVAPHDPVTLFGVALLMVTVGVIACWIPALRAARIDPGVALRAQ
jgi:predicted permease